MKLVHIPDNVDEPIIETATASPVIWIMLQTLDDNKKTYR